jgi:hypothetical protein
MHYITASMNRSSPLLILDDLLLNVKPVLNQMVDGHPGWDTGEKADHTAW